MNYIMMFRVMLDSFLSLDLCVIARYILHIQIKERHFQAVRKCGVNFNNKIEVL
jgi:hypothetical protein